MTASEGALIRTERVEDRTAIFAVTASAFGRTDEARLVDTLRADGNAVLSLVAELEGSIAGHVLLSRLAAPDGCLALAPVSVTPQRQRRGVGSALIREALERAAAEGFVAVFVLGDPAYYVRFGFSRTMAAPFESAYPKEYFMALELRPGTLAGKDGPVVYPPAFDAPEK